MVWVGVEIVRGRKLQNIMKVSRYLQQRAKAQAAWIAFSVLAWIVLWALAGLMHPH